MHELPCREPLCARRAAWPVFSGSPRGRMLLVRLGCCVNTVVGAPALWQPRMESAPAGPTTRLEGGGLPFWADCQLLSSVTVVVIASL